MRAATEPMVRRRSAPWFVGSATRSAARTARALCGKDVSQSIASVAHMHCNRLFACDNRRMEALAYEFALREMMRVNATSR